MNTASDTTFEGIFKQTLGMGVDVGLNLLKAKGSTVLAREEAKAQIAAQQPYQQLAALSPNLGPNDPRDAQRQAIQQTGLMQGIVPMSLQPYMKYLLVGAIVVAVYILFRRR